MRIRPPTLTCSNELWKKSTVIYALQLSFAPIFKIFLFLLYIPSIFPRCFPSPSILPLQIPRESLPPLQAPGYDKFIHQHDWTARPILWQLRLGQIGEKKNIFFKYENNNKMIKTTKNVNYIIVLI